MAMPSANKDAAAICGQPIELTKEHPIKAQISAYGAASQRSALRPRRWGSFVVNRPRVCRNGLGDRAGDVFACSGMWFMCLTRMAPERRLTGRAGARI